MKNIENQHAANQENRKQFYPNKASNLDSLFKKLSREAVDCLSGITEGQPI